MVDAYTYGEVALIERRITGTEISVGVIETADGPVALPATEIVPLSGVYDFAARYNAGETRFYTPARVSDDVAAAAADAAIAAHRALGLRHISRVDFIVDEEGTPWFLEVNVLPGLTETSLVPQGIEASEHNLGEIYRALAELAIRDASAR
jgi:D-alanine-D-alanine ligase